MELTSFAKSSVKNSIKVFFTIIFFFQAGNLLVESLFPSDRITLVEDVPLMNEILPLDIQVCFKQALDLEALHSAGYCSPSCYYFGYDLNDKHGFDENDKHVIGWGGHLEEDVSGSPKGESF